VADHVRLLALIVAVLCGCTGARTFTTADRAAVIGVLDAQAAAWNRGDLAGYMAGYAKTDTLVFTSGGTVRRGWQATFDAYQKKYATAPGTMGALRFDIQQVDALGADGAIVLGIWTLTGGGHPATGIFSVALARTPDGWRVIHDHTSVAGV
jgi:ketosteroid isomerase-like protein